MKFYFSNCKLVNVPSSYLNRDFMFTVLSYLPQSVQNDETFSESNISKVHEYSTAVIVCHRLLEHGYNLNHLFYWVKMKELENKNENIF